MNSLGNEIKRRRKGVHLTAKELAARIGVTSSFVSLIENGKASPSLANLKKIADALNTTVSNIVAEEGEQEDSPVVKRIHRRMVKDQSNKIITQILTSPQRWKMMEPMVFRYLKTSDLTDMRYKHAGDEFALVLKGRLKVILDDKEYVLNFGDSIYFNSGIPHIFLNASKGETEVLSVNTPPNF